jgi:hypothetical protein
MMTCGTMHDRARRQRASYLRPRHGDACVLRVRVQDAGARDVLVADRLHLVQVRRVHLLDRGVQGLEERVQPAAEICGGRGREQAVRKGEVGALFDIPDIRGALAVSVMRETGSVGWIRVAWVAWVALTPGTQTHAHDGLFG